MNKQHLSGKKAEDVACNFLLHHGLTLITRNFHCRYGEIDLIMQDADTLVFVEVRYRRTSHFGNAVESIDANKQRKLVFTANHYLSRSKKSCPARFDVVALSPGETPQWISNAFMANNA